MVVVSDNRKRVRNERLTLNGRSGENHILTIVFGRESKKYFCIYRGAMGGKEGQRDRDKAAPPQTRLLKRLTLDTRMFMY